ncbi:MAG: zincin-like metallopeptidase domain-containing protein, partial [Methylocystis sp.]|uniref:zincin-like metallopeptidase domain-containing protein n=1 Tax=Methylocystis sp. TaxID=1911079 RepID=UPI003DA1F1B5
PRVPGRALIMPNSRMANAGLSGLQRRPCGIIRIAALCVLCRYRHKTHWVGHSSRLARDLSGSHGSKAYAREELIAEMAGAFVCASLGIAPTVRHADYIGSWLEVLREDDRAIVRAASAASKGADYLLAFQPDHVEPADANGRTSEVEAV